MGRSALSWWGVAAGLGAAVLAALILVGSPRQATAAAFCLTGNTMPPQCNYESARQCEAQAQNPGIGCVPNPAEIQQTFGGGRFCVATEQRIQYCLFSDFLSCNTDAQRRAGICYDRHGIGPADPYRYDTRRPY